MGKNCPGSLVLKRHCRKNWLANISDIFLCIWSRQGCGKNKLGAWLWGTEGNPSGFLHHQHKLKNIYIKIYCLGGCILGHKHEDKKLLNLICGVRKARNCAFLQQKGITMYSGVHLIGWILWSSFYIKIFVYWKIAVYCKIGIWLYWSQEMWAVKWGEKFSSNVCLKFCMCRRCLQTQVSHLLTEGKWKWAIGQKLVENNSQQHMAGHQKPETFSSLENLPGNPRRVLNTAFRLLTQAPEKEPSAPPSWLQAEERPTAAKGFALTW